MRGRNHLIKVVKIVAILLLIFYANGSAMAAGEPDTNPTVPPKDIDESANVLPAVLPDKIFEELYIKGAGWLKWVVLIVIVFGGICYAASKSEESRASGASYIKNAVIAVVSVMVGIWAVNWLYTL